MTTATARHGLRHVLAAVAARHGLRHALGAVTAKDCQPLLPAVVPARHGLRHRLAAVPGGRGLPLPCGAVLGEGNGHLKPKQRCLAGTIPGCQSLLELSPRSSSDWQPQVVPDKTERQVVLGQVLGQQ